MRKKANLTREDERRLGEEIAETGSKKAISALVNANLGFAESVTRKYVSGTRLSFDDVAQEAKSGLVEAAKHFDHRCDIKFISYAAWWIKKSILRYIADMARSVRLPLKRNILAGKIYKAQGMLEQDLCREPCTEEIASHLSMQSDVINTVCIAFLPHISLSERTKATKKGTVGDLVEYDENVFEATDAGASAWMLQKRVGKMLDALTRKERRVIKMRYGITPYEVPHTLAEIGDILDVSRERARQIQRNAIKKLRELSKLHTYGALYA